MIRVQLGQRRRALLRDTLDVGEPNRYVHDVLSVTEPSIIVPVRHAAAFGHWLGRCHAHFGLGYPTTLIELHTKIATNLAELHSHPAMWGHGMLGQPRTLPISCWSTGDPYPHRMYSLEPVGEEGYLVSTKLRLGSTIATSWLFEPMRHGQPRPATEMFRPSFATAGGIDHDPATQDAATAHVRAVILGEAQAALEEDGGDLPPPP